jgi:hypothetical protein
MTDKKQSVLKFELTFKGTLRELFSRFRPQGKSVLNRSSWRGKEPRSCSVTGLKTRPMASTSADPITVDIEVTYRPKGCIVFVGGTKYDGWTAMVLDRKNDGTLLDGGGNPLPEGQEPVYLPYEVFDDVEFNEIDFGEFIGESELGSIRHVHSDDVFQQLLASGKWNSSIKSTFTASRRNRPNVKIILTDQPSGVGTDGFGTRIINVSNFTPHLQQILVDHVTEVVCGFIEGRYSIKNSENDEMTLIELGSLLVDCTPNAEEKPSRFDCLTEYMPDSFLEDLAQKLMSAYEIDVSIVDGISCGLLLRKSKPKDSFESR